MSHQVEIKLEVRDLDALRAAARELGCQLLTQLGAKVKGRTYQGEVDADAVIKLPGLYDVILNRQSNGSYKVSVDYYTGYDYATGKSGIAASSVIGENGKRLTQLYGVHKATLEARKLGHTVTRSLAKNGTINLCLSGSRL